MDVLVAAGAFEGGQAVLVDLSAFRGHLTVTVLQQEALPADLHGVRVHLQDIRERDELVHKLLPNDFLDDVLVVVVSQRPAQLVVVHVCLVLAETPQLGHFFRLEEFELAIVGRPADEVLMFLVQQQMQEELPQRDCALHTQMRGVVWESSWGDF